MAPNPHTYWTTLTNDDLTVDVVEKVLSSVEDDLWVAAACTDRVLDDVKVQQSLLHIGIARTDTGVERSKDAVAFASNDTNGAHGKEQWVPETSIIEDPFTDALTAHFRGVPVDAQLCSIRTVLLERLDRLNTYVEICKKAPNIQKNDEDNEDDEWEDDPWGEGQGESRSSKTMDEANSTMTMPITLSNFLSDKLLTSACLFASLQWFGALRIMFQRHGSLSSSRLSILNNIPEHIHPLNDDGILDLFPNLEAPTTAPHRSEKDWSETPEVQIVLTRVLPAHTPFSADHRTWYTVDEISTWYQNRVDAIVSATGLVDTALVTIQHGASQGIPGLDGLGEELSLLSRLVYDAPQGPDINDWTLDRWRAMDPATVMRQYLAHSTPDSLSKDITHLVMPYLYVLEAQAERAGSPDPQLPNRILYDYILSAPLEMVAAVFEASKPTLPIGQRLIRDDEDIARLALACLYGSDNLDQWSTMSRIFECLPAWEISRDEDVDEDTADTTLSSLGSFVTPSTLRPRCTSTDLLLFFKPLPVASLSRALDILDIHLESGEILSRWSVPAPLRWFLQSNADVVEQRSWAARMARRAGGSDDQLSTVEDWEWLLEDMLKLSGTADSGFRGAFGLLQRDEIMRIFFSGILSSGKFDLAQELLRSPKSKLTLDNSEIEDICLSCSQEFYDNASSGNYTFGDMKLAYDCLDVPRVSERILREKGFIEATSRISSFNVVSKPGIPISPIEIRLTKDRLSLVSRVLSSNNDAYKHTEVILDLVRKLGFTDDVVAEVKALAMLADTALQAEDFQRAYELTKRMSEAAIKLRSLDPLNTNNPQIAEANGVCWVACFQLGRQSEFDDLDKKLLLLGWALELCPQENLPDVLGTWRRLEKENIQVQQDKLSSHSSGTAATVPSKRPRTISNNVASSLRSRLQNFHLPSPPLLSTPDAAALASRTFRSVAATLPFSVGHSHNSEADAKLTHSGDQWSMEKEDVSTQATRVFSKGIGWLIGADEGM